MKKLVAFGVSLYLAFALSPAMAAAETICSDETLAPSDEAPAADLVLPDEAEGDMSADEAVLADVPAFPQPVKQSPKPIAAARTGTENLLPICPNIFFITEPPSFSNTVTARLQYPALLIYMIVYTNTIIS